MMSQESIRYAFGTLVDQGPSCSLIWPFPPEGPPECPAPLDSISPCKRTCTGYNIDLGLVNLAVVAGGTDNFTPSAPAQA